MRKMKRIAEKHVWNIRTAWKQTMKKFADIELDAVGVVEMILILVVLIALVIIFQEQLTQLVNNIFSSIRDKAGTIY